MFKCKLTYNNIWWWIYTKNKLANLFEYGSNENGTWSKNLLTGEIVQTMKKIIAGNDFNVYTYNFPIPFTKRNPVLTYGHNSGAIVKMCRPSEDNLHEYSIMCGSVYSSTLYMIAIGY